MNCIKLKSEALCFLMRLKHVKSVESLRGHPIKLERYVKSVEESIVECGKEKRVSSLGG